MGDAVGTSLALGIAVILDHNRLGSTVVPPSRNGKLEFSRQEWEIRIYRTTPEGWGLYVYNR